MDRRLEMKETEKLQSCLRAGEGVEHEDYGDANG